MTKYDEEAVAAFAPVSYAVESLRLPLMQQRRYACITNAIEIQLEDGYPRKAVIGHLASALVALLREDGLGQQAETVQEALAEFQRKIESRLR